MRNLIFLVLLFSCSNQSVTDIVKDYFSLVRKEFSGHNAKNIVAFVEKDWRVVGNKAFDASIYHVIDYLKQAGYKEESKADPSDRLIYRLEKRPLDNPTWEPVSASLTIDGQSTPFISSATNRNMVTLKSYSTTEDGFMGEIIYVGKGTQNEFRGKAVKGKIVFGEAHVRTLYREAVQKRGAVGVIAYSMPSYLKPDIHKNSIQFSSIPYEPERKSWGLLLSTNAKDHLKSALDNGKINVRVDIKTRFYESEELTLIAEVKGSINSEERLVFSAHVQEPGANDNASGVGAQAEMARVAAKLLEMGEIDPKRSITFIWGDEIRSTANYIREDKTRASGIKWGISLDMVGEDTEKTGGTFLIEKMPDPSTIWTRGNDKHSEWGGEVLDKSQLKPHYLNDFILSRFKEQGEFANWVVNTNPFEGGSDHVPFLHNNIPGLLLWHFTDEFYHTDGDRIDKVSEYTLHNVGVGALVSALLLTSGNEAIPKMIIEETSTAAINRLNTEFGLSKAGIERGSELSLEIEILETWSDWYLEAIKTTSDIELDGPSTTTLTFQEKAINEIKLHTERLIADLKNR